MNNTSALYVGIVDFSDPTLLIIGDTASLLWLGKQLESRREIDFAKESSMVHQSRVNVRVVPASTGGLTQRGGDFVWAVSQEDARLFAEQLRGLALAPTPAHAYLDVESNNTGIQIVASKEEHDPDKVFERTADGKGQA